MVTLLTQPLALIALPLGGGFLLPLLARRSSSLASGLFLLAMLGATLIAGMSLSEVLQSGRAIEIQTAGISPPFSINLLFGPIEGFAVFAINLVALIGAMHLFDHLRARPGAMSLYLILVMGIDGMIMTRDLFNLFIFIEVASIATYGLLGDRASPAGLAAGFKYIMATTIASSFFLLGTLFVYHLSGSLNLDDLIRDRHLLTGPIALTALTMLVTALVIELKPYPANGWGLDVYENAPAGIAALISVGVSGGMILALFKLLPLLTDFLPGIAGVAGLTFLASNLIGLRQKQAQRLLGYSSIGQMALIMLALALLFPSSNRETLLLVAGGLFLNHLLAKAGLFWLAADHSAQKLRDWRFASGHLTSAATFLLLLAALIGLPPFPGFWAKWSLIMELGSRQSWGWIALILVGSLLEAAYLFRWYGWTRKNREDSSLPQAQEDIQSRWPALACLLLLTLTGLAFGQQMGTSPLLLLPILAGLSLLLLQPLPSVLKNELTLAVIGAGGYLMIADLQGIALVFGVILLLGGLGIGFAGFYRREQRPGYQPLLATLILSFAALLNSSSSLEFFFSWEMITLSSYLILSLNRRALPHILGYLLFSLLSAFLILAGFAAAYGSWGGSGLHGMALSEVDHTLAFALLALGFLVKVGGIGLHVWLPGAYSEADDDFSAFLSAVLSKAAVFGLMLVAGYLGIRAAKGLDVAYILAWLGMLTATFGALFAVFQEDMKRLLAYSSMGQVGYIVTGVATMSHLGWVAALYMTVNHFLYKALLFLAIAGVIHRVGTRLMYQTGGLIRNMPVTFVAVMIGIIAVSGVPPLTGFGGKWLLFNALMDKGWHWLAAIGFFSSAIAFLYLYRLIQTVFLGQRKLEHREVREAPWTLLLPQGVFILLILLLSFYPKLLLDPLAAAVSQQIPGSLHWDGWALVSHLGQWNAPLVGIIIGAVWLLPLLVLLAQTRYLKLQKVEQFNIVFAAERPHRPETTHYAYDFFAHYQRAMGFWVKPRATAFWDGVNEWAHTLAGALRNLYTGNGQTYMLFVLFYFVLFYGINGGLKW